MNTRSTVEVAKIKMIIAERAATEAKRNVAKAERVAEITEAAAVDRARAWAVAIVTVGI